MYIKGATSYLAYGLESTFGTSPSQLSQIDFGVESFRLDKGFQAFTPIDELSRNQNLLSSVSNNSGNVNLPYGLGLLDDFWQVLLRSNWSSDIINNSNFDSSLYIEKGNDDLAYYTGYSGSVINSASIDASGQYATFDADILSKEELLDTQVSTTFTTVTEPTDLFTSVSGHLKIDSSTVAAISNFNLSINNNYTPLFGPGESVASEFIAGTLQVTGSFSLHVADNTIYNKFVNEEEFSLQVKFNELLNTSNYNIIDLLNIKISESNINFDKRSKTLNNISFKAISTGDIITVTRSREI